MQNTISIDSPIIQYSVNIIHWIWGTFNVRIDIVDLAYILENTLINLIKKFSYFKKIASLFTLNLIDLPLSFRDRRPKLEALTTVDS